MADHVEIQVSGDIRLQAFPLVTGEAVDEVGRAKESEFFARPGGEHDIPWHGKLAALFLIGEIFSDLKETGDA